MIGRRLAGGQALNDGQAGLGDKLARITTGAAATIGTGAGIALSAPLAIVDGRTRENLGEQIEDLGSKVQDTAGSAVRFPTDKY
jgi:hypothetical protein